MNHKLFCYLACAVALSAWSSHSSRSSAAGFVVNPFEHIISSAMAQAELPVEPNQQSDLERRFNLALRHVDAKRWGQAETAWRSLLESYPQDQVLYINLAAVLAQRGKLEQARETLLLGIDQRTASAGLYKALSQVHGALAASAYSKVIDGAKTDVAPAPLALPVIRHLAAPSEPSRSHAVVREERQKDALVQKLTEQVARLELQLASDKKQHLQRIAGLELALQQQQALTGQQAGELQQLRRRANAQKRVELSPPSVNAEVDEPDTTASPVQEDEVQEDDRLVEQVDPQHAVAIDLVRAWASAWSAGNLSAYINYYVSGYSPGRFISHDEWLQQNQARFDEIEEVFITVSDFVVSDLGTQFAVTFTQHYRSKTFDESIRKRLVFELNGGPWSAAKIVSEHTVSG